MKLQRRYDFTYNISKFLPVHFRLSKTACILFPNWHKKFYIALYPDKFLSEFENHLPEILRELKEKEKEVKKENET